MSNFQRARTDEQRAARRQAILDVTRALVEQRGVAGASLNEVAREVGLAKSNVLRYFPTREAILLTLLASEYGDWAHSVGATLPFVLDEDPRLRVARTIATTVLERPLLCELLQAAPTVLELNLSAEVAREYKGAMTRASREIVTAVSPVLGGLDRPATRSLLIAMHAFIVLVWAANRPSPGMTAALEQNPELRSFTLQSDEALTDLLFTFIVGLAERPGR